MSVDICSSIGKNMVEVAKRAVKEKEYNVKSDLIERFVPILLVVSIGLAFVVGMLWQKVANLEGGGTKVQAVAGAGTGNAAPPAAALPSTGLLTADQVAKIPTIGDNDRIRGNKDAKVTILEYSDLECPFCKQFHPTVVQAVSEYSNDVRWVYRHFPLDQIHSKADKEAEASECAFELGGNDGFWKFIDKIYEVSPTNNGLDLTTIPSLANQLGLNGAAIQSCIDSGKYADKVEADYQGGISAGIGGTPGVFILNDQGKGWTLPGAVDIATLKKAVEEALKS